MKRLSILAMTALMAFFLSACGENVEKKVEGTAETAVDSAKSTVDDTKPAGDAAEGSTTDSTTPAGDAAQPAQ